ncbi:unnamed protein product [Leuciscus chuanchicus]
MDTSIPSLLLVLWLKSFLNWLVVVIQRHYMIRTFSGFFCISLALIDSLLSFVLTAIFYLEDVSISGWHFTRYYICLLTQIACFIYAMLHWPVFLLVGLDNFWTLSSSSRHTSWTQKLTYIAGVCLLWILAALYVFRVDDVALLFGDDEKHQCKLFSSPQSSQILVALLLTVTFVMLYSYTPFEKWRVQEGYAYVSQHMGLVSRSDDHRTAANDRDACAAAVKRRLVEFPQQFFCRFDTVSPLFCN